MASAFERLAQSVLRHLGQDAFLLAGAVSTPVRANVEHDVQLQGPYEDGAFTREVVTVPASAGARTGDRVQVDGATYLLDGAIATNGFLSRFTATKL
jgi:hypothetical protein